MWISNKRNRKCDSACLNKVTLLQKMCKDLEHHKFIRLQVKQMNPFSLNSQILHKCRIYQGKISITSEFILSYSYYSNFFIEQLFITV